MEAREHHELVELLQARLREHGLGSIATVGDVTYDPDSDEYRATQARERLIEMLLAFERHLAARDPATVDLALERINRALEEGHVRGAIFDPLSDAVGSDLRPLSGESARGRLREQVMALVGRVRDED